MCQQGQSIPRIPQALVSIIGQHDEVLGTINVILAPKMGLLDALKEARVTFELQNGFRENPFDYNCKF